MKGDTLAALRRLAKRKCKITWKDNDTEERITEIVENAVPALCQILGMSDEAPEVFLIPGMKKTLFENYCMYDWNDMLDEFQGNYKKEIIAERHKNEVENAKKKTE